MRYGPRHSFLPIVLAVSIVAGLGSPSTASAEELPGWSGSIKTPGERSPGWSGSIKASAEPSPHSSGGTTASTEQSAVSSSTPSAQQSLGWSGSITVVDTWESHNGSVSTSQRQDAEYAFDGSAPDTTGRQPVSWKASFHETVIQVGRCPD